ncbi:MAG: tRNA 2-thiouridine(34) synthase MnmA, partial [bacterium]|nr:tRNA 2-thiouridine(34) synthase MnmA [bacterium]
VGLSGGVDSSVSALLLKKEGSELSGVFIRVWQPDCWQCSWKDDRLDAMRICASLAIPFIELDLEKEYKKEVVDYMIREYKAGKTPNPDVMCNRFIKFGGFYSWAMKRGADFIATGHYARVETREFPISNFQFPKKSGKIQKLNIKNSLALLTGADVNKDQSYFLWQIRKEQLPHILFPVGGMKKPNVRKLAKRHGLITADKKDSQGLCFIGKVDMKEFLKHYIKEKPGTVRSEKGKALGTHAGAFLYTIGERYGGAVTRSDLVKRSDLGEMSSYYVIAKDVRKNTLTVSTKKPNGRLGGMVTEVELKNCNWLLKPLSGKVYSARTRYRQPLQRCRMVNTYGRRQMLCFEKPQTIAPGQSLVLYDNDLIIGGGIIS